MAVRKIIIIIVGVNFLPCVSVFASVVHVHVFVLTPTLCVRPKECLPRIHLWILSRVSQTHRRYLSQELALDLSPTRVSQCHTVTRHTIVLFHPLSIVIIRHGALNPG